MRNQPQPSLAQLLHIFSQDPQPYTLTFQGNSIIISLPQQNYPHPEYSRPKKYYRQGVENKQTGLFANVVMRMKGTGGKSPLKSRAN